MLLSHSIKVIFKILQQYVNQEFPDVQSRLGKGSGTREQLPTYLGSYTHKEIPVKIFTSVSLTPQKPLTMWITTNCGQF